jgi:hypothetical protein
MTDMATLMRNQLNASLTNQLNAAVQAGDIAAAHAATKSIAELAAASVPQQVAAAAGPKFSNDDIRKTMQTKAPWFGTDPRRSAKAVEFAKNMEPSAFETVEKFSDALIKAVDDEFKPAAAEPEPEDEEDEPEAEPVARKKTDAPTGDTGRSASRGGSSGPWGKLSDAPKDVSDNIKRQADKFTRTKEARDKFIVTALGSAYADHQRKAGAKK